uniref:DUF3456 domain-containing protein n=1 Tax=Neobodo designis TaxID=312471 RepID=A0A7S1LR89_NEODS|mmetsp:Transcript_25819/g.79668  ORF Transcript_25819/g.79668 Transcript_25819/m.79668 type:complete len:247 (+) Transcript_25819:26-766(+)|eukprot:CAMPEP_0174851350 /NCGR_PEP_ID=MMETSP1114-20130205/23095_1 /TAXON_ID=312471 /ORGANISM="Neobodo designis, Strain CCAP 1951/1" /LENGTH=246 /DNA_ID=CAMNT_0016085885 /DNA_START=24 /DNA_END=764 /DNA_ORIENTATION=+
MRRQLFALLLTLGAAGLVTASSRRFETHPHLQCSACRAVATEIGVRMNETAKVRSSVKKGHRLAGKNRVTYQDYESSELRAIEIMEKICADSLGSYQLRLGSDNVRTLTKDTTLRAPRFYGRADREQLDNVVPRLKDFCFALLDDFDESIVSTIKTERTLESVTRKICDESAKLCNTAKADKGRKADMAKFEKSEAKRKAAEEQRNGADANQTVDTADSPAQPPTEPPTQDAANEATAPPSTTPDL